MSNFERTKFCLPAVLAHHRRDFLDNNEIIRSSLPRTKAAWAKEMYFPINGLS